MGDIHRLTAFDLDGTLVDSRQDLADAANALLVEIGGTRLPDEAIVAMVGEGAAVLVRRALAAAGLAEPPRAVERFLEIYDGCLLDHTVPYPDITDALCAAREIGRVAVLTNKPARPSERILDGLGLRGLVDEVIGGDGPLPRKPDPAALLASIERAGGSPATALMIGDSAIDLRTAVHAGVQCCLVSFGFGFDHIPREELTGEEWIASDAAALCAAIRRAGARSSA